MREMHRVRVLENDWTRGNAIGFAISRVNGTVYAGHGGGYPGYTTQTLIQLDSKVGVIVLTNTNDLNRGESIRRCDETTPVGSLVEPIHGALPGRGRRIWRNRTLRRGGRPRGAYDHGRQLRRSGPALKYARLAQHGFRLLPNLLRDLVRIALLQLRKKELY